MRSGDLIDTPEDLKFRHEASVPNPALIKHLRDIVAPPGKKANALRDCSDQQLLEIYYRLKESAPLQRLVKLMQGRWGVCTQLHPDSLRNNLRALRNRALPELYKEMGGTNGTPKQQIKIKKALQKRARTICEKLDSMERMRWLIERQTEIVQKWEAFETKLPLREARKDRKLLMDMLTEFAEIEMDLGTLQRVPTKISVDYKSRFDMMLQNRDDGGAGLIEAAHEFLQLGESKTKVLVMGEDGSYSVEDPTEADKIRGYAFGYCGGIGIQAALPVAGEEEDEC